VISLPDEGQNSDTFVAVNTLDTDLAGALFIDQEIGDQADLVSPVEGFMLG